MKLGGRRAVVTGASSGIGRAVACALAGEGAAVIVSYCHSQSAAEACVAEIRERGGTAHAVAADVTSSAAIRSLVTDGCHRLGGIDLWVNMAGADILTDAGAELADEEKLVRLLDTDLRGTILCSWAAADELSKHPNSCLINTSWDLALHGMAGRNPEMFAATKAGITGFTRALARSLAPKVRVNEVAPGWIETEFARTTMSADYRAGVISSTPLKRFGQPQDVADAVVFLASNEAAFITGQTLMVNGGVVS
ncbi:MAG: SDR family oxidoreductase [Gammaproteobacteria bacterium]|nr:SDR family oxidoreductase [Gammaproteobacteria bacterium]